ncbi:4-diphosphocytidyl-2-C-methyl-D-erythritol kinase [Thiothrix eikelboomii]|uniref:4-diphosphocytidyl-2-C-methyl-D-erythritol kinase n=1 Tax=Thiothrix eikelboomii TaxID=92487 RepID=A0A1T4XTP4_9GAMM|nr:4-(cytidine 5'-diphospho)-2-C-methyl-D-erythritol kinase [Thiothrix eikelboomii]SKA92528.1 4-diphosphocytidyl-2-C-methyl-D-erythritol kinase [Thiothrix eikelboomii]
MENTFLGEALSLPAPAKLNLFLHITGRRADGYHLLQTLFQFLDYSDVISLQVRGDGKITRSFASPLIPENEDLVVKAARLLQQATGCQLGVDIKVHKILPMGGGLGGGSSDAATVLLGLNYLWNLQLDLDRLAAWGLRLGADVPVFVQGHAAWAEGVGERLEPVNLPEKWYFVLHPKVHISTAEVFSAEGLTRNCKPIRMAAFLAGQTTNVFEPVVRKNSPEVAKAFEWLGDQARLTGSGACLFAEFDDEASAQTIAKNLPKQWSGFVAKGRCVSPLHEKLNTLS